VVKAGVVALGRALGRHIVELEDVRMRLLAVDRGIGLVERSLGPLLLLLVGGRVRCGQWLPRTRPKSSSFSSLTYEILASPAPAALGVGDRLLHRRRVRLRDPLLRKVGEGGPGRLERKLKVEVLGRDQRLAVLGRGGGRRPQRLPAVVDDGSGDTLKPLDSTRRSTRADSSAM
jgi:hypothetical protein